MLVHELGAALRVAARPPRAGRHKSFDPPGRCDAEKTKPQQSAELPDARIPCPVVPTRAGAHSEPDLVASTGAIFALQEKLEIKSELQFANDQDAIIIPDADEIATADLSFDGEPKLLQEAFYRPVEMRL